MTSEEHYEFNKKPYWREVALNSGKFTTQLDYVKNFQKTVDLIDNYKKRLKKLFSQTWWPSIKSGPNNLFELIERNQKLSNKEISSILLQLKERNSKLISK